mgnify:CR=1 FL=1
MNDPVNKDIAMSETVHPLQTESRTGARVVGVVVGVLGLTLLGFIGVRVKESLAKRDDLVKERVAAQASATVKAPLAVTHAKPVTFRPHVEVTGTLQPWRSTDVGFEQSGRLVRVLVSTGDSVKDGQVLAVLDASMAGAQVSQAEAQTKAVEAQLSLAEDNLKRTESLVATKSIADAQAVQARQQVALARAQLEGARATERLAHTGAGQRSITAPFAGLVTKAPTSAGTVVSPGMMLMHLEDHSRFRLSATLSEEESDLVKVGTEVTVKYHDRSVTGHVVTLVPSLDQATRRAPLEVEVPNSAADPLLAWSFVHATIDGGKDVQGLRLPATVRRPGAQNELVVVKDGKLHFVRVQKSTEADGSWVVRDGLASSDVVLLAPAAEAKEGDVVDHTEEK